MKRWIIDPFGILEALATKEAHQALDFVKARTADILKLVLLAWLGVLFMAFTLVVTVRLALQL